MGGEKTRFFFFFGPKMGPGKQGGKRTWRVLAEEVMQVSWKGKEVRLRVRDELGDGDELRGEELRFVGWRLFCTVYLHLLTHSLVLSKHTWKEWINACMGDNSGSRARNWHSVFLQRASSTHRGGKYHFGSGRSELKSKLYQ